MTGILTETQINTNHKENRKGGQYTYFFAGGDTEKQHRAGVGIIIRNELVNYMTDVQPIYERIVKIILRANIPTTFIAVYAHTAQYV